jgi:hypothetical protein
MRAVNTGDYCPLAACGGDQFCCGLGQSADDCCSAGGGFSVGTGPFSLPTQTVTSTSVVIQVANSGVFTSTTTVTSIFSSNAVCHATAGGVEGAAATNSLSNNAGPSASCPNCSTREAAIGAGVGIPLSAALIASLILLFLRGKRDKHPPATATTLPTISQSAMIQPYPTAPPPGPFSSGYPSGVSHYDQYPNSPGGVGGYVRPRDPVDPIPIRVVSPDSDGGRYELGGHVRRGNPPTYLSQGKT